MAKFLLKRSSVIVARDEYSRALAQQFVGAEREVLLSPDVAFSLEAVKPEPFELDSLPSRPASGKVIGLNVNGLMYNGGYTRNNMFGLKMRYTEFLPELIRALLAEHAGELWLVPHTYAKDGDVESDNECSKKLMEKLPPVLRARIRIVNREYDPHQLKWIIGQCGFFVGSRMHSCIAALSQGVPCVGVAYSGKFDGVFNSVGLAGWVVDGRVSEANSAVKRIVELYRQREGVKKQLLRRAGAAREQLKELFDHLVDRHTPGASEPVCHETAGVLVTTQ
jgi:polysaccharide pyruvyl transferase WcaK-like protein